MPNNGKRKRNEDKILNINKNKQIKYQNILDKLGEEDGKYFKVDNEGINCELCHNLERRVFLNLKKFTKIIF